MNDASPSRRSFWRFSLRELLLPITAAASVMALAATYYKRSLPFVPTKLRDSFGDIGHFQTVIMRRDPNRSVDFYGGGGPSGRGTDELISYSWNYVADLPKRIAPILLDKLKQEAEQQIGEVGGQVIGSSTSSVENLDGFGYFYRAGQVQGEVRVFVAVVTDDKVGAFIFLHEYRLRP